MANNSLGIEFSQIHEDYNRRSRYNQDLDDFQKNVNTIKNEMALRKSPDIYQPAIDSFLTDHDSSQHIRKTLFKTIFKEKDCFRKLAEGRFQTALKESFLNQFFDGKARHSQIQQPLIIKPEKKTKAQKRPRVDSDMSGSSNNLSFINESCNSDYGSPWKSPTKKDNIQQNMLNLNLSSLDRNPIQRENSSDFDRLKLSEANLTKNMYMRPRHSLIYQYKSNLINKKRITYLSEVMKLKNNKSNKTYDCNGCSQPNSINVKELLTQANFKKVSIQSCHKNFKLRSFTELGDLHKSPNILKRRNGHDNNIDFITNRIIEGIVGKYIMNLIDLDWKKERRLLKAQKFLYIDNKFMSNNDDNQPESLNLLRRKSCDKIDGKYYKKATKYNNQIGFNELCYEQIVRNQLNKNFHPTANPRKTSYKDSHENNEEQFQEPSNVLEVDIPLYLKKKYLQTSKAPDNKTTDDYNSDLNQNNDHESSQIVQKKKMKKSIQIYQKYVSSKRIQPTKQIQPTTFVSNTNSAKAKINNSKIFGSYRRDTSIRRNDSDVSIKCPALTSASTIRDKARMMKPKINIDVISENSEDDEESLEESLSLTEESIEEQSNKLSDKAVTLDSNKNNLANLEIRKSRTRNTLIHISKCSKDKNFEITIKRLAGLSNTDIKKKWIPVLSKKDSRAINEVNSLNKNPNIEAKQEQPRRKKKALTERANDCIAPLISESIELANRRMSTNSIGLKNEQYESLFGKRNSDPKDSFFKPYPKISNKNTPGQDKTLSNLDEEDIDGEESTPSKSMIIDKIQLVKGVQQYLSDVKGQDELVSRNKSFQNDSSEKSDKPEPEAISQNDHRVSKMRSSMSNSNINFVNTIKKLEKSDKPEPETIFQNYNNRVSKMRSSMSNRNINFVHTINKLQESHHKPTKRDISQIPIRSSININLIRNQSVPLIDYKRSDTVDAAFKSNPNKLISNNKQVTRIAKKFISNLSQKSKRGSENVMSSNNSILNNGKLHLDSSTNQDYYCCKKPKNLTNAPIPSLSYGLEFQERKNEKHNILFNSRLKRIVSSENMISRRTSQVKLQCDDDQSIKDMEAESKTQGDCIPNNSKQNMSNFRRDSYNVKPNSLRLGSNPVSRKRQSTNERMTQSGIKTNRFTSFSEQCIKQTLVKSPPDSKTRMGIEENKKVERKFEGIDQTKGISDDNLEDKDVNDIQEQMKTIDNGNLSEENLFGVLENPVRLDQYNTSFSIGNPLNGITHLPQKFGNIGTSVGTTQQHQQEVSEQRMESDKSRLIPLPSSGDVKITSGSNINTQAAYLKTQETIFDKSEEEVTMNEEVIIKPMSSKKYIKMFNERFTKDPTKNFGKVKDAYKLQSHKNSSM